MGYDELGFAFLSLLALAGAAAYAQNPRRLRFVQQLLLAAVLLRIVGSTARHEVIFRIYRGLGDAVRYFYDGQELAAATSPLNPAYWVSGPQIWGTQFLIRVSGAVTSFIGPTLRGEFFVFALFAFGGLYAMAVAFHRVQPGLASKHYARWIWFWPSLWFWPSSVGKEAVLVLGIGLAVLGYAGRRGQAIDWPIYLAGLGVTFLVRPHVAAVIAFATVAGHWLGAWQRFNARRLIEAVVAMALLAVAFNATKEQFGLADADLEGIREFMSYHAGQTMSGGSQLEAAPITGAGLPMAFINVWLRPFPWDVHNATAAVAALEILVLWFLVWRRRQGFRLALRYWRHHRLLQFAVPFLAIYTLMIGLTFANLGIIARQRTPMFPFFFMIVAAVPVLARGSRAMPRSVPHPLPGAGGVPVR